MPEWQRYYLKNKQKTTAGLFKDGLRKPPPRRGRRMDTTPVHLIEVTPRELPGLQDTRGESIRSMLLADHNLKIGTVRSITGYQVKANLSSEQLLQSLQDLFTDPIIEQGTVNNSLLDVDEIFPNKPELAIMIGFKPGVTDNAAQAALDGLYTLFPEQENAQISTTMTYLYRLSLIHI